MISQLASNMVHLDGRSSSTRPGRQSDLPSRKALEKETGHRSGCEGSGGRTIESTSPLAQNLVMIMVTYSWEIKKNHLQNLYDSTKLKQNGAVENT